MATILQDRTIRSLLPRTRRYEIRDGEVPGLVLRVNCDGSKAFMLRFRRPDGGQRRKKLGNYPDLSLSDARKRARRLRQDVADGLDPVAEQKSAQRAAALAAGRTFEALASDYLDNYARREKRESSWREDERYLRSDLLPAWSGIPVAEIGRVEVARLLDEKAKRAPVAANRLRALISKMFNFGLQRGYADTNPALLVDRPAKETPKERRLSEEEIEAVWSALNDEQPVTAAMYRVLLLTAQRPGEVRTMRWVDIEGAWWTIPAADTKSARASRVPLSELAMESILRLEDTTGHNEFVFESPVNPGRPIGRLTRATSRLRQRSGTRDWTPHDFRRTAATHMARLGVEPPIISRILNHADHSITAIYNRHAYDDEKRAALELWGERVRGIASGSGLASVVPFSQGA